mgnify:CR=1 FL=1
MGKTYQLFTEKEPGYWRFQGDFRKQGDAILCAVNNYTPARFRVFHGATVGRMVFDSYWAEAEPTP